MKKIIKMIMVVLLSFYVQIAYATVIETDVVIFEQPIITTNNWFAHVEFVGEAFAHDVNYNGVYRYCFESNGLPAWSNGTYFLAWRTASSDNRYAIQSINGTRFLRQDNQIGYNPQGQYEYYDDEWVINGTIRLWNNPSYPIENNEAGTNQVRQMVADVGFTNVLLVNGVGYPSQKPFTPSVITKMTLSNAVIDSLGGWDNVNSLWKCPALQDGWYRWQSNLVLTNHYTGPDVALSIYTNGALHYGKILRAATIAASQYADIDIECPPVYIGAGTTITFYAYSTGPVTAMTNLSVGPINAGWRMGR